MSVAGVGFVPTPVSAAIERSERPRGTSAPGLSIAEAESSHLTAHCPQRRGPDAGWRRSLCELVDQLDQFVLAIALLSCEPNQLLRLAEHNAFWYRAAGDVDPAAAAEFEQPLVAELA
jgi:hypothetical protein